MHVALTFVLGIVGLLILTSPSAAEAGDRLHHSIDLALEPEAGRLDVTDRIDVSGHEQLAIKLAPGLMIDDIRVDGQTIAPEIDNGVTWIPLPSDGDHRVELAYGGVLENQTDRRGLSPMISEDGVFLPYGIGWLANAGAEDDRVTYELTITTPVPYKAIATGRIAEERETVDSADDIYRATFEASNPTEPPSIFAGDLKMDARQHGDINIRTYFPADRQDLASTYLDQAAGYIDLFEEQIGAYPYDDFSIISAPLPVGLGFPGLTYISSQILHMPFMLTRSLAHEIAHNWWANGVFVEWSEGNWSEGLTTYMADYGLAEAAGEDPAWEMRLGWLRDFAALPADRDKPITAFRSKGHDADQVVGYNKVAMVFHMLKQELGEEAFSAGIKDFWETYKFKTASWSDLQASFEAASDRELSRFFEAWLNQKGAPQLTLETADLLESEGGYKLDLKIASNPADYDLLVPVQIAFADRIEESEVRLADGGAEVTFELDAKPISIGIDQRHDLFRRLAADEAPPILRDVTLNAGTLTVIAANGSETIAKTAEELAARTLDTGLQLADAGDEAIGTSPLMLVGLKNELAPILAEAGIDAVPEALQGQGTARAWVAARSDAPPALVVEADDEEALGALLRPLPHYGRQSFLVFDGRRAIYKGVWPTGNNALTRRFD
ncbi:MAG: M1 family aminopeptidase [Pseudomonadota bacterium]